MSRLLILPALLIGLPLIGCAQAPAPTAGAPETVAQATPTGSHVKGGAADPFLLTVDPSNTPNAPDPTDTKGILLHSTASPFLQFSGR